MVDPLTPILGTAMSAGYLALNATARIIDVMVAQGVISKKQAGSILLAIAEETRDDIGGSPSEEPGERMVAWLEEVAKVKYLGES